MDKHTHDMLKKENEILDCEKRIEKKVDYEMIILIVMLLMELPQFLFYLNKLLHG